MKFPSNGKKPKVEIERLVHGGYTAWIDAKKRGIKFPQMFGKNHYIYTFGENSISLIQLLNYYTGRHDVFWEAYCLEGELFEDVKRYATKQKAEKEIIDMLINPYHYNPNQRKHDRHIKITVKTR